MNRSKINKQISTKSNYPIYFSFVLLAIVNFIYVSSEIHKPNVLKSMGYDFTDSSVYQVTKAEVAQISAVARPSLLLESAFLIILIACMLLLFTKRFRPFFTRFMVMTFSFLSLLFILNLALATIFDVPPGNLTQLLILPFQFLVGACIIGFLKFRDQTN